MIVDSNKAISFFDTLSTYLKIPCFHPVYTKIDSFRASCGSVPLIFLYESCGHFFYFPFLRSPILGTEYFDIQSPYGYGGPIVSTQDRSFLEKSYGLFRQWCRDQNIIAEFVRFHPLLENWRGYDGEALFNRETVYIDLRKDLTLQYETRVRTSIRKAEQNGLKIVQKSDVGDFNLFKKLYFQGMEKIGASEYYFFEEKYFSSFLELEKTILLFAYMEERCVAAAIFLQSDGYLEYHLSASLDEGRKVSATNLLLHKAALMAQEKGCLFFHLGGGTDAATDNRLLFFKSGFSKNRAKFFIGKKIILEEEYANLKKKWEENNRKSELFLFYR